MDEDELLKLLPQTIQTVQANLKELEKEWKEVKAMMAGAAPPQQVVSRDEVIISKFDLDSLASEAEQMKDNISKIMKWNILAVIGDATKIREDLKAVKVERDTLRSEISHWKTQLNTALSEDQKQKQEQLELRIDLQELTNQLSQQSEFCSSLGASCCTLLWRVSRQEDCIQNIISGNRSEEFLSLLSNSIESYLNAYKNDEWPAQGTDEANFLLALCGIITKMNELPTLRTKAIMFIRADDVAASAVGREYLASNLCGQRVVDIFVTFIAEAPLGKSCAMKNLMLMSLYNMSINQKGLAYLCGKPGVVTMLASHLKDETNIESQTGSLRLLQSLILDEDNPRLIHELKENLTMDYLYKLTKHNCKEIQELSLELVMDLRQMTGRAEQ